MANRYSVYERGTDRPILIWGTSAECATALGITLDSFYTQIKRSRQGLPPKKYEIVVHTEKEEDVLL